MADQENQELWSYCRQCGGERHHSILAEVPRPWREDDPPISGSDTYSILECGGCHTVTFLHSHWFSEDWDLTEIGLTVITHRDFYPPAPMRKFPEWGVIPLMCYPEADRWIDKLHKEIYAALGLKSYALAAMGVRSIVDFVVSSRAGEVQRDSFEKKTRRLFDQSLITRTQADLLCAAFDAGSAAAHRGYRPTEQDVFTLLDIAESLLRHIYIEPVLDKQRAVAGATLRKNTPPRRTHDLPAPPTDAENGIEGSGSENPSDV